MVKYCVSSHIILLINRTVELCVISFISMRPLYLLATLSQRASYARPLCMFHYVIEEYDEIQYKN